MKIFLKFWKWLLHQLRTHFLTGLIIIVPLTITALILIWLFDSIDNILQPIIVAIAGHSIRGVGFGVLVIIIYIVGLITSNLIGKKVYYYLERFFFYRIPVVKQLYQGIKQILQSFSSTNDTKFLQVVLVEFPRKGLWSIGFVTNKITNESGKIIFHVFVPYAPNPMTGNVVLMREDEIIYTKMSVEEAFKLVVSAGKYAPDEESITDEIHKRGNNAE
jgi:uncharacterized membrane protein